MKFNIKYPNLVEQAYNQLKENGFSVTKAQVYKKMLDIGMIEKDGTPTQNALNAGLIEKIKQARKLLKELEEASRGSIEIMAGGGVCAEIIETLRDMSEICCFHMSGKETLESGMIYRNPKVNMGLPGISEFEVWRTSEEAIRRAVRVLKNQ